MKNLYLLILVALLFNCKSIKTSNNNSIDDNVIVYILPTQVEKEVKKRLDSNKLENRYFDLRKEKDYYVLYFTSGEDFYSKKTNRKLIVGKKVYPLVIDYDYDFATTEDLDTVLKRLSKPQEEFSILRKSIYPIYDSVMSIKFTRNGDIIYKGSSW